MSTLQNRFKDWLNSDSGEKTKGDILLEVIDTDKLGKELLKSVQDEATKVSFPSTEYPSDINGHCGEPYVVDGKVQIEVFLNHDEHMGEPFWPHGNWSHWGDDQIPLIPLMNNGWSFTPKRVGMPRGEWREHDTAALSDGPKNSACIGFITRAVNNFEDKYDNAVTVEVNEVYK